MSTRNRNIDHTHFSVEPHAFSMDALVPGFSTRLVRKNYTQKNIFTIRHMLAEEECLAIIDTAEKTGFQPAGLAIGEDVYRTKEKTRNNQRMMFEDKNFAAGLWARIADLVDPKFNNHHAYGLNWRFRIYKYEPGEHFSPHVDERMELPGEGLMTFFTFMIYLNSNCSGGETTFLDRRRKRSKNLVTNRVIKPRTGMALAFDHLLFHEGSEVTRGIKYVLRSDIIYSKSRHNIS